MQWNTANDALYTSNNIVVNVILDGQTDEHKEHTWQGWIQRQVGHPRESIARPYWQARSWQLTTGHLVVVLGRLVLVVTVELVVCFLVVVGFLVVLVVSIVVEVAVGTVVVVVVEEEPVDVAELAQWGIGTSRQIYPGWQKLTRVTLHTWPGAHLIFYAAQTHACVSIIYCIVHITHDISLI